MNDEYIIINKSVLEKRIEKLKKKKLLSSEVKELEKVLSQSTPLIPEIEKAIKEGIEMRSESQIYGRTEKTTEDYISKLKLDI